MYKGIFFGRRRSLNDHDNVSVKPLVVHCRTKAFPNVHFLSSHNQCIPSCPGKNVPGCFSVTFVVHLSYINNFHWYLNVGYTFLNTIRIFWQWPADPRCRVNENIWCLNTCRSPFQKLWRKRCSSYGNIILLPLTCFLWQHEVGSSAIKYWITYDILMMVMHLIAFSFIFVGGKHTKRMCYNIA